MELAVSVIGQMASHNRLWESVGLWAEPGREGWEPSFLVNYDLDRCGAAYVARGTG
jgi:hypothetical protein